MRRFLIVSAVFLGLMACDEKQNEEKQDSGSKAPEAVTGNMILEFSELPKMDSLEVKTRSGEFQTRIAGNKRKKIGIETPVPLPPNLYQFIFYTQEGNRRKLLWLDGKDIAIAFNGKSFAVDTVKNSDLHQEVQAFSERYKNYQNSGYSLREIRSFLWDYTERNKDNPFSLLTAQQYYRKNLQEKENLQKILELLQNQPESLQNHSLNPMDQIKHQIRTLDKKEPQV